MGENKTGREAERIYLEGDAFLRICYNEPHMPSVQNVFFKVVMPDMFGGCVRSAYLVLKPHQVQDLIEQLNAMVNNPAIVPPSDISGNGFLPF